jgi:tripartite ATP-independent transporter DctP family solute receptor
MKLARDRKAFAAICALLVCSALCACSGGNSQKDSATPDITLRVGNLSSDQTLGPIDVEKSMIDAAKTQTDGHLTIKPFYNAALGDEATMIKSVQSGALDMALITSASLAQLDPAMNITELPYFWRDQAAATKLLFDRNGAIAQELFTTLQQHGLKGLIFIDYGFRQVISTKPLNTVADFQGEKIRVIPNQLYIDTWKAVGATAVSVDYPEVYTALQTGVVNAADTNPMGMVPVKWYEPAKYLALTNHILSAAVVIVNPSKWSSLPASYQSILLKAMDQGGVENVKNASKINDDAISEMQQHGLQVTHPDQSAMREAMKGVWEKWKSRIGATLYDEAFKAAQG